MSTEAQPPSDQPEWKSSAGRVLGALGRGVTAVLDAATAPLRFFSGLNNNPHNREKFGWNEDGVPRGGVGVTRLGVAIGATAEELRSRLEGREPAAAQPGPQGCPEGPPPIPNAHQRLGR